MTVVVVGGLDPGGGAGLLRDVATAAARGAHAVAVGTAWTEQGPGIHRVEPRAPGAVGEALARAIAARPAAVKVGMAVGPDTAAALVEALTGYDGPVVVDPVLATSRGGPLWSAEPRALGPLLRRATLVTPNAGETAALTGMPVATAAEAEAAGQALVEAGLAAVLVKGGHLDDGDGGIDRSPGDACRRQIDHPAAHPRTQPAGHRLRAGDRHRDRAGSGRDARRRHRGGDRLADRRDRRRVGRGR